MVIGWKFSRVKDAAAVCDVPHRVKASPGGERTDVAMRVEGGHFEVEVVEWVRGGGRMLVSAAKIFFVFFGADFSVCCKPRRTCLAKTQVPSQPNYASPAPTAGCPDVAYWWITWTEITGNLQQGVETAAGIEQQPLESDG